MYARQVEGQPLTFEASGALYKDALVMYDRQTQTLWTQADGAALRGPLVGQKLKPIPAVQTTWGEWKRQHPDTLVLHKPENIRSTPYANYALDPHQFGISGRQQPDPRLPGKALVVGLRQGDDALAVPLLRLEKKLIWETELAGEPILIAYDRAKNTARVFRRRFQGQVLRFSVAKRQKGLILKDRHSGNRWEATSGKAIAGPQAGATLEALPHVVSFWWAWVAYSPRTRVEP